MIDEIQMYGADLLADLIFGLKMIRELGGRIAITTATLAPFIKELIEKEVGEFAYGVFCDREQVRHKVKMIPTMMDAETIAKKFRQCLSEEGAAGAAGEDGFAKSEGFPARYLLSAIPFRKHSGCMRNYAV